MEEDFRKAKNDPAPEIKNNKGILQVEMKGNQ